MKTSSKRLLLLLVTSAIWTIFGSSCNTVRGVGRDVEHVGDGIQNATR